MGCCCNIRLRWVCDGDGGGRHACRAVKLINRVAASIPSAIRKVAVPAGSCYGLNIRPAPPARRQAELQALLDALHKGAAAVPGIQELDQTLESILSELTEELKFGFATISLVDEYRNCIETVRGRNVSPGWIMRAKHQMDIRDIQTEIVNTHSKRIIDEPNDLFDIDIYERFDHWRLARIWVPIVTSDHVVVGTIEAGCNKERKNEVFTQSAIDRVEQLGYSRGDEIAARRPNVLLQGIAKDAIKLIGADSASVHVYRRRIADPLAGENLEWGELLLAAGAGKATPEFVQDFTPSPGGRGSTAIRTGKPVWIDDPVQFREDYPKHYAMGVRALAVIPLKLGPDTLGSWAFIFGGTAKDLPLAN